MPEIKTKPIELKEGVPYIPKAGDVVFTENHTIADIVRYAIECSGGTLYEVQYVIDQEETEGNAK